MARRSRRSNGLFRFISGTPNVLSFVTVALLLTAGVYLLWSYWGGQVAGDTRYQLKPENIEIVWSPEQQAEQPDWVGPADVKAEAFRDGSLGEVSLLDRDAVVRVGEAFLMHKWVSTVIKSRKETGKVIVELHYRVPTALVEVEHDGEQKLQPVDADGYVLPTSFLREQEQRIYDYPRIAVDYRMPTGAQGARWGDPRVEDAARVASQLGSAWKDLGLYRIHAVTSPADSGSGDLAYFVLTDKTNQARRVIWGHAPGKEVAGEAAARDKAQNLASLAARYSGTQAAAAPADIDLTKPDEIGVGAMRPVSNASPP